ncbi:MAG: hypothetical protein ABI442_17450, partial [Gemmatimonadaceae bacterium]
MSILTTNLISAREVSPALEALRLGGMPPAFTRLEPQSVSGDPTPGLEARVHDPLWMLGRQWQLGEFHGEDVGTPIAVTVSTTTARVTVWQPGDASANRPAQALASGNVLDPFVEREPTPAEGPGLRQRAEAGRQLIDDLEDAGVSGVADALLAACVLALNGAPDPFDVVGPRLQSLLTGGVPDAELAARDLEAAPAAAPAWLAAANDPAGALTAVTAWLEWYRRSVAPLPDAANDS